MEEVTFRNKREDLEAYYEFFLNTEDGKQIGKTVFIGRLWFGFFVLALIFTLIWGALGYLGFSIRFSFFLIIGFIFTFIIGEVFVLAIMGFKPYYFIGKQVLKKNEKSFSEKDVQVLELPRTLKIEDGWLEVQNSEAVHRWRWGLVDSIGLTSDFIFLHVGKCWVFYVPKRDFSSEEGFQDFGKRLVDLVNKNKDQPLAPGSIS